jgi:mannose-6-phosphate isomerase-like protein (cupin superfamily)
MILSDDGMKQTFLGIQAPPRCASHSFVISLPMNVFAVFLALSCSAYAQFGGRRGDVVIYALTANGSGALQVTPSGSTNSPQSAAGFTVISLDSVPVQPSGFTLQRQVFYNQPNELFQVGVDPEPGVGAHRIFLSPVKLFQFGGMTNAFDALVGAGNTFLAPPQNLDVDGDISFETVKLLMWAPMSWPFIAHTNQRGPVGPPDISGWQYFFQIPGAIKLPSLMPWTNVSVVYPGARWPDGADLKLIEVDSNAGSTVQQLRLRPGKRTPLFRIAGHTHLFVLQGSATITPAGSGPVTVQTNDYVFLPENFAFTIANPAPYSGQGTQ